MSSQLVMSRAANALCVSVEVRPSVNWFMRWATLGTWDWPFRWLRKQNGGGLWVGGRLLVFDDHVEFKPNIANRALQTGSMGFDLTWSEIDEIGWRAGLLTSIIELRHGGQVEAVRCFGTKKLVNEIKALRSAKVS